MPLSFQETVFLNSGRYYPCVKVKSRKSRGDAGSFRFRLVFNLSFALSLSKGRPFMVRQAHHERTTLVTLNNEKTLRRSLGNGLKSSPAHNRYDAPGTCQSSCLSLGSSESRIQSPRKLKPTTVRKMAIPGKNAMPHELAR